jgi:tryptophan-rich sensory protein
MRAKWIFAALAYGAGALGFVTMRNKPKSLWYRLLRKPSFQPPNWLFGPVWNVLYGTIAYAGWRVFQSPPSEQRSAALRWWGAQMALNAAWTPLFFGLQRPRAALADIALLDGAATTFTMKAAAVDERAAAATLPYLAWLGLATALNASIVRHNPKFLAR